MPPGENLLVRAFFEYEMEERGRLLLGKAIPVIPLL
jgi:hypothetical protein